MAAGSATQRPAVTDWRSGVEDDRQQHRPRDVRRAMCGAPIREARYDRPDWKKCARCLLAGEVTSSVSAVPKQLATSAVQERSRNSFRRRLDQEFWTKTDRSGECWLWTGKRQGLANGMLGYGRLRRFGRQIFAHRRAYELTYGPIRVGLLVLHSCDNPACIRPGHLHLGTHSDNLREAWERGIQPRTKQPVARCRQGHPFDEANTIRRRNGTRLCRTCKRTRELSRAPGGSWSEGELRIAWGDR